MAKEKIITVEEAARRLEVHPESIRRAIRAGKLRAVFGGVMKNRIKGVDAESVDKILHANRQTAEK